MVVCVFVCYNSPIVRVYTNYFFKDEPIIKIAQTVR